MTRLIATLLALAACGMSSAHAQECPWMATADVEAAFPERSPWKVMAGGVGRCKFVSDPSRPSSTFSLTQIMRADAGAASAYVETTGKGMAGSYAVVAEPALGPKGVSVRESGGGAGRMLTLIGHRDRVVVMAQLSFFGGVSETETAAALKMAQQAFTLDTGGGLTLPAARPK
jgi:hypothetical protein